MSETTPVLEVDGLTKAFHGFRLGPLELDLDPGSVTALVGPNGAGKSTLMHCLTGLVRPDGGRARISGLAVDPAAVDWKHRVGFVGEVHGFFRNWSAARNLEFLARCYPGWSRSLASELAARLALPLDRPLRELSKGDRRKTALVAAMGHRPSLLLLDEPTAGLDPVVRAEVLDVLWEILEEGEVSVLYSTHVLSDISRLADDLVFLRDGGIVGRSLKDDLLMSWRRFSFRWNGDDLADLAGVRSARRAQADWEVVSADREATTAALAELGVTRLKDVPMTIDEVAVEILREGHRAGAR